MLVSFDVWRSGFSVASVYFFFHSCLCSLSLFRSCIFRVDNCKFAFAPFSRSVRHQMQVDYAMGPRERTFTLYRRMATTNTTANGSNASLPIISISPYLPGSSDVGQRKETASALHAACRDYGFFYLDISTFADAGQMEELMRLAREFFALPQEQKDSISIRNQDNARGEAGRWFGIPAVSE